MLLLLLVRAYVPGAGLDEGLLVGRRRLVVVETGVVRVLAGLERLVAVDADRVAQRQYRQQRLDVRLQARHQFTVSHVTQGQSSLVVCK